MEPKHKVVNITKLAQWFSMLDLDILSILAIPMWYNIYCSQLISWFDHHQLQLLYSIMEDCPVRNFQTKLHKPLLTHLISYSTFFIQGSLHFSFIFTFLEIIKYNMMKVLLFSSTLNLKLAIQQFTNFGKFSIKCTLIW